MTETQSTPVLIAGAGPIGLTLAADLAWRGIACTIIDPQIEVIEHPRAISIGVRSMEHFRRLGLDQKVIDAGVPRSQALDVVYVTRMLGREIFRFRIPSINDLQARAGELAATMPETAASPYYKTWTAQAPLERMLRAHLQNNPLVDMRLGWQLSSFDDTGSGVSAQITDAQSGAQQSIKAQFLIGCDGARSVVRTGLGIGLSGLGTLGAAMGLYFRAPGLREALGAGAGVMYWMLAPDCGGTIYTINGGDEWVYNRYFNTSAEAVELDPEKAIHAAIGKQLPIEVISALEWQPRQLVAESFGRERIFLAGDACHLFVPTGGLGMNTGIGDAADLAWKIAARLQGWGGPGLLASYEQERRPVGEQNTLEAADNYNRSRDIQSDPAGIEADNARGEAIRQAVAAKLPPKIKHFAPIGVHLGYRYEGSAIIVPDGTPAPLREAANYQPTARPGHRAPHVWLRPGHSILDLFGAEFVLLCFDAAPKNAEPLSAAAKAAGMPLAVEAIADSDAAQLYERRFVLVRPDGHVAWRGDTLPDNPQRIIKTVTGNLAHDRPE